MRTTLIGSGAIPRGFAWLSLLICLCFGAAEAQAEPIVAFDVITSGGLYYEYPYRVGNYFVVGIRPICIYSLGVFDDPAIPGLNHAIHVGLFDDIGNGHLISGGDLWIGPGSPGRHIGNMQFVDFQTPIILPPGFVGSIVAQGFDRDDPMAATSRDATILADGGGGAISFGYPALGWVTYDDSLGTSKGFQFDQQIIYGGGSFRYEAVTEPESLILLVIGIGGLFTGILCRRNATPRP